MITRLTRLLLFLQIAIALGISLFFLRQGYAASLAIFLGLTAIFALRLIITANNFFLAWRYRSPTPREHRLHWRQALRLFIGELNATLLSSSWTMPFYAFKKSHIAHAQGLPVLLIHGYGCNSGYWRSMSRALGKAHILHHALDLEPVFGSIDAYLPAVQRAIDALRAETGQHQIIIVAHSMGGLVARAYVRAHSNHRIAKIITLGTPHHGTALARYSPGINSWQMRWSGDSAPPDSWLSQLANHEDKNCRRQFISIYSHHDNIIAPQTSSHLSGAKNIAFHGIGHVALGLHPTIQKQVVDEIQLIQLEIHTPH